MLCDFYISVPSNIGQTIDCAILLFKRQLLASVALNERADILSCLFYCKLIHLILKILVECFLFKCLKNKNWKFFAQLSLFLPLKCLY